MAKVSKDVQAFKSVYDETGVIKTAALAAGYSDYTAAMGIAGLPQKLVKYVAKKQEKMQEKAALARATTAELQEQFIRGQLIENALQGKDQAVNSLKLLGQDKRVSMFTPDSQTGVIVIQAAPIPSFDPPTAITLPGVTLDGESK